MSKAKRTKTTTDAVAVLHRRYIEGKPKMEAILEEERANADIAQKIYDLRTKAQLSQRELARRVGTSASVICRLEDADYEGHSLTMLRRIAAAVNHRVQIHIVESPSRQKQTPKSQAYAVGRTAAKKVAAKKAATKKARKRGWARSKAKTAVKAARKKKACSSKR